MKENIIFIHLETQYAKIYCKNEIYAKNWVRRTWTEKVNPESKSTLVNGPVNVLVNDDVADDVSGCLVDDVADDVT